MAANGEAPHMSAPLLNPTDDAPPPCCTPDAHGALAMSTARGSFVAVHDWHGEPTNKVMYLIEPPEGTKVVGGILVIHDIFGPRVGRHTEICDSLAAAGFIVACPDLFGDGEARARASLLPNWPIKQLSNILGLICCCKVGYMSRAMKTKWESSIAPTLALIMRQLDTSSGKPLKWGAVGFCWGALPVARLLTGLANEPNVGCGIAFHPSLRGAVAEAAVRAVRKPLLLCPCGDDPSNVQAGGAFADVLSSIFERGAARGAFTDGFNAVHTFPDMLHGFMTRGPITEPAIARDYAEGVRLMTRFFVAHAGVRPGRGV